LRLFRLGRKAQKGIQLLDTLSGRKDAVSGHAVDALTAGLLVGRQRQALLVLERPGERWASLSFSPTY
jgi:hypothetical protein